jgi:eukaryotic-like serine/threonine-protein kinase
MSEMNLAQAVSQLASFGVNAGVLSYSFDSSSPGTVLTNITPFLSTNFYGQYIPLTLSQGPAPPITQALVPNVIGMLYSDAQLALGNARLLIASPVWALSATVKPQYVISQSISAGSQVAEQTQVTIVVSGFSVTNQPGVVVPVP